MAESIAESLRAFDTCTLADALDLLNLQAHSQGYAAAGLHCFTSQPRTFVGYAATARIRAADPPMTGQHYIGQTGWWETIGKVQLPRLVVIEDVDRHPGSGACVGLAGASILRALKCDAAVTNGAVRDVPTAESLDFGLFAASLSPSRAYAHLVDFGQPVNIFGLVIATGDLIAADRHGLLSIPLAHAEAVLRHAADARRRRQTFFDFCRSEAFSTQALEGQLKEIYV